jgi:hypothetical protein
MKKALILTAFNLPMYREKRAERLAGSAWQVRFAPESGHSAAPQAAADVP